MKKKKQMKKKTKDIIIHDFDFISYEAYMDQKENEFKEIQLKEQQRINEIKCPCCSSTNKKHVIETDNNGIIGPGHSSWIIEEYFICLKCGIMFKDIDKLK